MSDAASLAHGLAARRPALAAVAKPLNEQLLDLAETMYPSLFPGHASTGSAWGFDYRHYPGTGLYLGVAVNAPGYVTDGVYVMGGSFGPAPAYVGMVGTFVSPFACAEGTTDPLESTPQLCHDLTGDGVIDSAVAISGATLTFSGAIGRSIVVSDFAAGAQVSSVAAIGQHAGGPLSEFAVRVDDQTPEGYRTVLYVFDVETGTEMARWTQPFRTPSAVWVGYPATTGKRRLPVVAPGQEQSNVTWNYICTFAPTASGGACGAGFSAIDAYPPNVISYRRHQGAWVQDNDGDGTEDINISFYSVFSGNRQDGGVLSVSPVTGARAWLPINMAEQARDSEELAGSTSQPTYASLASGAQGFDSGRLYGAVSSFTKDGRDRALMVGGQPVGYFPQATTDHNDAWLVMCNVARYVGMLGNPTGQGAARQLEWAWYYGFQQAVFRNSSGDGELLKGAAMAHGCIHRYSSSRVTSAEGVAAVAFSVFRLESPAPSCEMEQRALFNGGFTDALQQTYRSCVIGTASHPGRWRLQVLQESDGSGATVLPEAYMWGYTDKLLPGGQFAFIVEPFTGPTPFARPSESSREMFIYKLHSSPHWYFEGVGTFPVTGRPNLRYDPYDVNPQVAGQHTTGNFMHLMTRPNSLATGLVDLQLQNGQWVGYSPAIGRVIAK